jgi:hypothetical protein
MRTDRTRAALLAALAAALLPARPGAAAPTPEPGVELLRDFTIALPPGGKTAVRLLVSPLPDAVLDRLGPSAPLFAVGAGDSVWLGVEPGLILNASRGYRLRPAVKVSDLAALEGGGLLVATADGLGYLVLEDAPGAPGAVRFQPLVDLPLPEARLTAAAGGALYLHGPEAEGGSAVYLLAPEASSDGRKALRTLRKVFSTSERIAAVAGDGVETYVATGKLVVKLSAGAPGVTPVLLHPREPILGLAVTRRGLLFYATASGVGVASPGGAVDFAAAPNAAIRAVGDDLYLLLRNTLAVVKIEGTESFRIPAGPAPKGR